MGGGDLGENQTKKKTNVGGQRISEKIKGQGGEDKGDVPQGSLNNGWNSKKRPTRKKIKKLVLSSKRGGFVGGFRGLPQGVSLRQYGGQTQQSDIPSDRRFAGLSYI